MERRLRILEEKKLAEGEGEAEAEGGDDGPPPAEKEEEKALATTDQQDQEEKPKAAAAADKGKKKKGGVKKSKAQQVLEGQKGAREEGYLDFAQPVLKRVEAGRQILIQIWARGCNSFICLLTCW